MTTTPTYIPNFDDFDIPAVDGGDETPATKPQPPTPATLLVWIAQDLYEFGKTTDGQPFLVDRAFPNVARLLADEERALKEKLSAEFFDQYNRAAAGGSISDSLQVIRGLAARKGPVDVHLRCARFGDSIVIDLGDATGDCVIVDRTGWRVETKSPVLFYRTGATGELPHPVAGGDLRTLLKTFVNVVPDTLPLVESWLCAALVPDIAHPIAIVRGTHGSGKSKGAEVLTRLVDPSTADVRDLPRNERDFSASAACSWVAMFDNVSSISQAISDALCRVVTGGSHVTRKLYSNNDVSVVNLRRNIMLTTIETGRLAADLESRSLVFDFNPLAGNRRTETELADLFDQVYPAMFGAVLTRLSAILAQLPTVQLKFTPRLMDFARIAAANDIVAGTTNGGGINQMRRLALEASADQVEASYGGRAVVSFMRTVEGGEWSGTKSELLTALTPHWPPRGGKVPADATRLAVELARIIPPLGAHRIEVRNTRTAKRREVTLTRLKHAV
jgi:hypothetical protein